jgi:Holliday junction resolvase RusA-like endonuclease
VRTSGEPAFRIWVAGRPQSGQKRGSNQSYTQRIRDAAVALVPKPTKSRRVDVEIWYRAENVSRGDVDNVIKPVLDALNGIVYEDDRQVRSVRAVAVPLDDVVGIRGSTGLDVLDRFNGEEFLINVFDGKALPRDGP